MNISGELLSRSENSPVFNAPGLIVEMRDLPLPLSLHPHACVFFFPFYSGKLTTLLSLFYTLNKINVTSPEQSHFLHVLHLHNKEPSLRDPS